MESLRKEIRCKRRCSSKPSNASTRTSAFFRVTRSQSGPRPFLPTPPSTQPGLVTYYLRLFTGDRVDLTSFLRWPFSLQRAEWGDCGRFRSAEPRSCKPHTGPLWPIRRSAHWNTMGLSNSSSQLCNQSRPTSWHPRKGTLSTHFLIYARWQGHRCLVLCTLQAYSGLVDECEWKEFAILYDFEAGLMKLQELIKVTSPSSEPKRKLIIRQLNSTGDDFRQVFH